MFFFLKKTCSICHYILYSLYRSFYNSEFRKKQLKILIGFPHFCKLDSNDEWVESCGSTKCSQNHNIRKNVSLLSWSCHDMNWLDFLAILDCYWWQHIAECRFCKRCSECHRFKQVAVRRGLGDHPQQLVQRGVVRGGSLLQFHEQKLSATAVNL